VQRKHNRVVPHVFHRAGKPVRSFRIAFRTACRLAGCPGRVPHDFRRTAVRNLVRAGIPERVAMQMTRHKTRSVFERYNIVSPGDLREAARRLDRLARGELA
jgi:integrase